MNCMCLCCRELIDECYYKTVLGVSCVCRDYFCCLIELAASPRISIFRNGHTLIPLMDALLLESTRCGCLHRHPETVLRAGVAATATATVRLVAIAQEIASRPNRVEGASVILDFGRFAGR